ncbi:MAG: membrane dipeptidase [Acidobacteria bacterium RIFCSPLOWO2_02_FULL_65_29]|nr:MAG: membrane dipeptidase [Acidobacteria bacterium RIFCSPLOWO2_02_FULL_65_29]
MSRATTYTAGVALAAAGVAFLVHSTETAAQAQQDLVARARAIHERVITLDTHNDIDPSNFTPTCNYTMRLTTQVNLPKMKEGGQDVSFMIVYVGQSNPPQVADAFQPSGYDRAYKAAIAKFDAVHRLTEQIAPKDIELALSPADVVRIAKSGKKVAVIGIENGYPMGTDVTRVKEFFDRGGRYMSLAHNGHNQLADSHTGEATNEWRWGGLSPLGRQALEALNRVGIMVDVSHPSKGAVMQAIGLSKAPVIASHSAVRKLANVSRNMDDDMLMAMKTNGGVVQIVGLSGFVKSDPIEREPALNALRQQFGLNPPAGAGRAGGARGGAATAPATPPCPIERATPAPVSAAGGGRSAAQASALARLTPERRAEHDKRLAEIDTRWPAAGRATVSDLADHIDYAVKLMGIDHVGISSDFDGGGGVDGWNSAADTFNVTLELVRRGYTEEQIGKIWSGNLLRVWGEVERVARQLSR